MKKSKKVDPVVPPPPEEWEYCQCMVTEGTVNRVSFQIRKKGSSGLSGIVGWTDDTPTDILEAVLQTEYHANLMALAPEMREFMQEIAFAPILNQEALVKRAKDIVAKIERNLTNDRKGMVG